ncbi:MAG TPA: LamG domain-containing protein, partial [Planctomycetaceae bacterium]|nr:LamG domain-containing protein [Planctomycetaceae bacterium]
TPAATTDSSRVRIDLRKPGLRDITIASNNLLNTSLAKPDETITLTFESLEKIKTPVVKIAGHPASVTDSAGDTQWTATYQVQSGDDQYLFSEGLTAHYLLDGNANDLSGNDDDGTVEGAILAADRHGREGKALSFDGTDDNVVIAESEDFERNSHTISFWVKADSWGGDLVSKDGESEDRQWLVGSAAANGQIRSHVWTTSVFYKDSNTILSTGEWHHVLQVWDGSSLSLYLNGTIDNSLATNGPLKSGSHPIR